MKQVNQKPTFQMYYNTNEIGYNTSMGERSFGKGVVDRAPKPFSSAVFTRRLTRKLLYPLPRCRCSSGRPLCYIPIRDLTVAVGRERGGARMVRKINWTTVWLLLLLLLAGEHHGFYFFFHQLPPYRTA